MTELVTDREWKVQAPVPEAVQTLPSVHPIVAGLLWQRGVRTAEEAIRFLEPDYDRDIHDPFLFSQMEQAVSRIFHALETNEYITIHGDYDADGVTGSAVLMTTLREIAQALGSAAIIDFYVPHREKEGYGLHNETVGVLALRGTKLIITVDCGIANREAIAVAKERGMDTVVVDHHEFPPELPEAILIHPLLPGERYPFPFLAAVGVSWKAACALLRRARERGLMVSPHLEKWLLDLVAIATVTDVMPLVGENRVLEYYGLKVLAKTRRLGLQKLYVAAGIKPEKITTTTVGFQIGPRINAAGRMEHADAAFRLLMAEDVREAETLAAKLHGQNIERQEATKQMLEEARRQVLTRREDRLLWAVADGWPAGLVGLVAGKLAQEFARPVLIMGRVGDRVVGSGRSIPGFHITRALREVGECLERFGGHPQACGFTIVGEENLTRFTERVVTIANERLAGQVLKPMLYVDGELALADLNWDFVNQIVGLAPHGEQNPLPRFLTSDLEVLQADVMGESGRHFRLTLGDSDGRKQKFVAFGMGNRALEFVRGSRVNVVYEVGINEWNGSQEIQCKVTDIRLSGYPSSRTVGTNGKNG